MRRIAGCLTALLSGCASAPAGGAESTRDADTEQHVTSPTPTALIEVELPPAADVHQLPALADCRLQLVEPIRFDVAAAAIEPESDRVLDSVAELMINNPRLRLVIEGHTHNQIPDAARSRVASEWGRLLDAIKARLLKAGIDERRISTSFMSDFHPIASNATAAGRARNTRVEFRDADCTVSP